MDPAGEALLGVYVDPTSRAALARAGGANGGAGGEGAELAVDVEILPVHSARCSEEQAMPRFFAMVRMPNCRVSSVLLSVRLFVDWIPFMFMFTLLFTFVYKINILYISVTELYRM